MNNELSAANEYFAQKFNFPTCSIPAGLYRISHNGYYFMARCHESGGIEITSTEETMAMDFHFAYEQLAPNFQYDTRKESAVSWDQVPKNNKELMIATCSKILKDLKSITTVNSQSNQ